MKKEKMRKDNNEMIYKLYDNFCRIANVKIITVPFTKAQFREGQMTFLDVVIAKYKISRDEAISLISKNFITKYKRAKNGTQYTLLIKPEAYKAYLSSLGNSSKKTDRPSISSL